MIFAAYCLIFFALIFLPFFLGKKIVGRKKFNRFEAFNEAKFASTRRRCVYDLPDKFAAAPFLIQRTAAKMPTPRLRLATRDLAPGTVKTTHRSRRIMKG